MLSNKAKVFKSQMVTLSFSGSRLRPKTVDKFISKPKRIRIGFTKQWKAKAQHWVEDEETGDINVVVQFDWVNWNSAIGATNLQFLYNTGPLSNDSKVQFRMFTDDYRRATEAIVAFAKPKHIGL